MADPSALMCIDFSGFVPKEKVEVKKQDYESATIPETVYRRAHLGDRVAFVFDLERVTFTFSQLREQMDILAAGLLGVGIQTGDRVLISGGNLSQLLISSLACARIGAPFSLVSANWTSTEELRHALVLGEFKALIGFPSSQTADLVFRLLAEIAPEVRRSPKGKLKSEAFPHLEHVILAEEEHAHASTWTLSDVYARSTAELIRKLPNFEKWSTHRIAALQFTQGTSGPPKLCALSHAQLLGGARALVHAFGITSQDVVCMAQPLHRLPLWALATIAPFVSSARVVVPDSAPLPRHLLATATKFGATLLVSNGAALRLLLTDAKRRCVPAPAQLRALLLCGERCPPSLVAQLHVAFPALRTLAVGFPLTETGSLPLLGDHTTDRARHVGRPIAGYKTRIVALDDPTTLVENGSIGRLQISAFGETKFLGYEPELRPVEWIDTGDVARTDSSDRVEVLCHSTDIVRDAAGRLVAHWIAERILSAQLDEARGVQLVQLPKNAPQLTMVVATHDPVTLRHPLELRARLLTLCREHRLPEPHHLAAVTDFPRRFARIQKHRLREWLIDGTLTSFPLQ